MMSVDNVILTAAVLGVALVAYWLLPDVRRFLRRRSRDRRRRG